MVVMRSCCCCSVRTGSMLIAVLYMLFTGLLIIGLGLMLAYFNDVFKPLVVSVIHDIPPNESSYITSAVAASIDTARNVLVASIVVNSIYFFLCLLLFVGAAQESPGYMVPWLVADFFRQLLFFAAFIFLAWFTSLLVTKWQKESTILILFCVLILFVIVLTFYFWLAIIGASQELRERDQRVSPDKHLEHLNGDHVNETSEDTYITYE